MMALIYALITHLLTLLGSNVENKFMIKATLSIMMFMYGKQ
jgi:hypothetical protein